MMKIHSIALFFFIFIVGTLANADDSAPADHPPKAWNEWVLWAEQLHPITDAHGHGPDVGSDEWAAALSRKLEIEDDAGHGPDYGSKEWRKAVETKLAQVADKPDKHRELLSAHKTIARFKGISDHRCLGRTARCPDQCGHSGRLASFQVLHYLDYRKPGEYGDPKQQEFQILIDNTLKQVLVDPAIHTRIKQLKAGDLVKLSWNHDYITEAGSKYPERVIVEIDPITEAQAKALGAPPSEK